MAKYKATEKFFKLKDTGFPEGTITTLKRGGAIIIEKPNLINKKVLATLEEVKEKDNGK